MTKQEAIERIKATQCWKFNDDGDNECSIYMNNDGLCEDCEYHVAIECIEKQIPKKPMVWANGTKHCPICDAELDFAFNQYTCCCGQSISWGHENDADRRSEDDD